MARYGIIDLGSNTIRLCIYEIADDIRRPLRASDIDTLLNYKIMAGLASYVKGGNMTPDGVAKAVKTINAHLKRAENFFCKRVDIFATAVLRNCANSLEACRAIEDACGKRICILTNEEEAHLGFLGASLDKRMDCGTMVDIGGGSTELTRIEGGLDLDKISLPQGSLSSYSAGVAGILPTEKELNAIGKSFRNLLSLEKSSTYKADQLYGIGGSIRSAAKIYGDLIEKGKRKDFITPQHVDEIIDAYLKDPGTFAHQAIKTVPDRIHTFLPGCAIIREIFSITGAEQLTICKYGVREGYLAERILVKPVEARN